MVRAGLRRRAAPLRCGGPAQAGCAAAGGVGQAGRGRRFARARWEQVRGAGGLGGGTRGGLSGRAGAVRCGCGSPAGRPGMRAGRGGRQEAAPFGRSVVLAGEGGGCGTVRCPGATSGQG
ncbi:hypothetical protein B6E66_02375 [Streptomyces maremycinicus]|nr:hypothetical protein B6E66_02375 [Streptomyces sp. B9173]